jgi:hypothetical protein
LRSPVESYADRSQTLVDERIINSFLIKSDCGAQLSEKPVNQSEHYFRFIDKNEAAGAAVAAVVAEG